MEMMVLDNPSALPVPCDGLLGLDFFKALNSDVLMDFKGSYLKCGNYQSLLPIALRSEFKLLLSKKVPSGLPVVSSSIPVPSSSMIDASDSSSSSSSIIMPGSKPIVCNAMLDVGSLYTIANSAATQELLVERYGSVNQESTGIFAADVPGLSNLGLNQGPSLIVGMDVLASTQLVLRRNGDIMMRLNE